MTARRPLGWTDEQFFSAVNAETLETLLRAGRSRLAMTIGYVLERFHPTRYKPGDEFLDGQSIYEDIFEELAILGLWVTEPGTKERERVEALMYEADLYPMQYEDARPDFLLMLRRATEERRSTADPTAEHDVARSPSGPFDFLFCTLLLNNLPDFYTALEEFLNDDVRRLGDDGDFDVHPDHRESGGTTEDPLDDEMLGDFLEGW